MKLDVQEDEVRLGGYENHMFRLRGGLNTMVCITDIPEEANAHDIYHLWEKSTDIRSYYRPYRVTWFEAHCTFQMRKTRVHMGTWMDIVKFMEEMISVENDFE